MGAGKLVGGRGDEGGVTQGSKIDRWVFFFYLMAPFGLDFREKME